MKLMRFTGAALSLMAGLCACTVGIEEGDVFAPSRPAQIATTPAELRLDGEEAFGTTAGEAALNVTHGFLDYGTKMDRFAWTLVSSDDQDSERPLVLYCGGNAFVRFNDGVTTANKVLPFGDILMFDYPGSGDTTGEVSPDAFTQVAETVLNKAEAMVGDRDLVLWGHSLGGFVCGHLASLSSRAEGILFETSARNAEEVARAWKPWYLPFVRVEIGEGLDAYDNADAVADFDGEILVVEASQDTMLPPRLARSLYDAIDASGRDVSLLVVEAEHSTAPQAEGFVEAVATFFADIAQDETASAP